MGKYDNINFNTMSKDEVIAFFSEMDGESFDDFARDPAFQIAMDKFFDEDHPASFARVPEEIAMNIWARILLKYCKSDLGKGGTTGPFDLNKIKSWSSEFKRIWDVTPYKEFKDLLSQCICRYYAEVAEYIIMNDVKLGNMYAPAPFTLVTLIEKPAVLEYAAKNSSNDEIREIAQRKIKEIEAKQI